MSKKLKIGFVIEYLSFSKSTKDLLNMIQNDAENFEIPIIINQNISDSNITEIIDNIKKVSDELNFVSMSRTKDTTNINLDIYPKKFENLVKITNSIKNHYKII